MKLRRKFTARERVAIGELVGMGQVCASSAKVAVREFGAVVFERAANIVRGESKPSVWSDDDVATFIAAWKVEERARFNPAPGEKRKK